MSSASRSKKSDSSASASPLMVTLDEDSQLVLNEAAHVRRISVSDYVRTVAVAQARREVQAAQQRTLTFSADEQLAFWQALDEPAKLTPAQRRLGALVRGES